MLVFSSFLPPRIPFIFPQTSLDSLFSLLVYRQRFSTGFMKFLLKNLPKFEILWFYIANLIRNQWYFDHRTLRYVSIYIKIFRILWCVSRGILVISGFCPEISDFALMGSFLTFLPYFLNSTILNSSIYFPSPILVFSLSFCDLWMC